MIVVDTNVVVALLIAGPNTAMARKARKQDRDWRAPPLWRAEFLNVLWLAITARKLHEDQAFAAWKQAVRLIGPGERTVEGDAVLRLALKHGITAYDAHFVALAEELGEPLVTADHKSLADRCPSTLVIRLSSFASG